jgi:hypothetical protein
MKSLQSVLAIGAVLLTSTVVFAAPPFGSTPSPSLLGTPAPTSQEVLGLIAEGKAAYQKGDIEKAKAAFETAYSMDSRNVTVINFLRQIRAVEATRPKSVNRERQLSAIIIPKIQFREATLSSALDFLKKEVDRLSGGRAPVSFVLQMPAEQANSLTVTLNLTNIPASEAIRYLAELAGATVTYDTYAVVLKPKQTAPVTVPQSEPAQVVGLPAGQ